jgi:hypothetical protein
VRVVAEATTQDSLSRYGVAAEGHGNAVPLQGAAFFCSGKNAEFVPLAFAVLAVEFHEVDVGRFFQLQSQVAGDLSQRVIQVRKVVDGHIADKRAANFIIARAAMQPSEENRELDEARESDDDPVGIHSGLLGARDLMLPLTKN